MNRFLQSLTSLWRSEDTENRILASEVSLIVPLTYGTLSTHLTDGTKATTEIALQFLREVPRSYIMYCPCSHPHGDGGVYEKHYRSLVLWRCSRYIVGPMADNTVDEALKIRDALKAKGLNPVTILLVSGEWHSRSARYVWGKVFPDCEILVTCIGHFKEVQVNHPLDNQRSVFRWIMANVLRHLALRILPLSVVRRINHRST